MKKVLVVLLLLGALFFCLIAAVGGFGYYKWHKIKKEGGTPSLMSLFKKQPPPEIPSPSEPEPQPTPPPEIQPSPEVQPPPSVQPSEPTPSPTPPPAHEPAKPKPKPAPRPVGNETPSPAPWNDVQPDNVREPSSEPLTTPPPASEPAPRIKTPKGTLGVIFETEAEGGDVLLHVDEELVEKQSFRASSQQKFRLTKNVPLAVGSHKVRITVVKSDGKTVGKEWQVDVAQGSNPVWKAELSGSGRAFDLKQIQAR